jgi:DNA-binding MarR family transcriptional regulator
MNPNDVISLIATIRAKANQFIIAEMNRRGIKRLATSHGDILSALFEHEPLAMKELAQRIDRDKSTVTTLVDKLIAIGYIRAQKDINDSRVVLVSLTEKGRQLQSDFAEISSKLLTVVYQGIEVEEQRQLMNTLTKIKNNF